MSGSDDKAERALRKFHDLALPHAQTVVHDECLSCRKFTYVQPNGLCQACSSTAMNTLVSRAICNGLHRGDWIR